MGELISFVSIMKALDKAKVQLKRAFFLIRFFKSKAKTVRRKYPNTDEKKNFDV